MLRRIAVVVQCATLGLFAWGGDDGFAYAVPNDQLGRQVLDHALLHRYSRLPWYLEFMPEADPDLDDIAEIWFGGA